MARSNSPIFNPPNTGPINDTYQIDRVPLDQNEFGMRKSQLDKSKIGEYYKFPIETVPNSKG
jgi:hypothetical protein